MRAAPAHGRCAGSRPRRGFIVVAVLWILAALATLATIFSMYVINTATAFTVHDERLQAEGAGARRDRAQPSIRSPPTRRRAPTRGSFRVPHRQCAGERRVHFRDRAHRPQCRAEGTALRPVRRARRAAQRRPTTMPTASSAGAAPSARGQSPNEAANYRAAGHALWRRAARRSRTSGNSRLVLGIPEVMVERALAVLTVYSGQPQINIFNAAPQVLAALPGMDPARLNAVLVQRAAAPQNAQTARHCWRCSAPHRRSRTHKGARRCG